MKKKENTKKSSDSIEVKTTEDANLTNEILSKINTINSASVIIELLIFITFFVALILTFIISYKGEENYNYTYGINNYVKRVLVQKINFLKILANKKLLDEKNITASESLFSKNDDILNMISNSVGDSSGESFNRFIYFLTSYLYGSFTYFISEAYGNKYIGSSILRQIRVEEINCSTNDAVVKKVENDSDPYDFTCYPDLEDDTISTKREPLIFNITNISNDTIRQMIINNEQSCKNESINVWNYNKDEIDSFGTANHNYASSGYVIQLNPLCPNFNSQLILFLMQNKWVDRGTRGLFIENLGYNIYLNKLTNFFIFLEYLSVGGVEARVHTSLLTLEYDDWIFIISIFILTLFIIYYSIEEAIEIVNYKFKYLIHNWSLTDLTVIITAIIILVFEIVILVEGKEWEAEIKKNGFETSARKNFTRLNDLRNQKFITISIFSFFSTFKLMKYLQISQTMRVLILTIRKSLSNMFEFGFLFIIIFYSFVFTAYELFSIESANFNSYTNASIVLLRLLLGDLNYRQYQEFDKMDNGLYMKFFLLLN